MAALLSYAEAAETVAAYAARRAAALSPAVSDELPLLEAFGRVLAASVLADRDQPPFARSTRDGFAGRAAELAAGLPLRVAGLLKAGGLWTGLPVAAGEVIEIMTGAPLPPGADCVAMVEHVLRTGDEVALAAGRTLIPGENVVPAGAEARAGDVLLAPGVRLGPAHLAASASAGAARVAVYRKPRVAILSTGDELVPVDGSPSTAQIRNSNSYSLAAQVLAFGGEPLLQPIAGDSKAALHPAIEVALEAGGGCDLLLLSGGVSMGGYDLVEEVLVSLGARFFFTGVHMQPGKPVVFGEVAGRPFFGLPGNPVSTLVTCALFAAPLLAALGGQVGYALPFCEARLAAPVARKANLRRFLPARLQAHADAVSVLPVPWQGSGDIAATAGANCLLVTPELPEGTPAAEAALEAGAHVRVLLL